MLNFKKLTLKVRLLLEDFMIEEREASFIRHNKKIWGNFLSHKGEGEILVESLNVASSIIAFSYLANLLAKKHSAKIKAYALHKKSLKEKILSRRINKIYKSFNAQPICYDLTQRQLLEREKLFNAIYPSLRTKKNVEDLRVGGVWIGDLLYDSHLKKYRVPTVNIEDSRFHNSLREALGYYLYWRDYLDSHNVKSVIVSHCGYYQNGTVLRLAIQRRIPCYQINAQTLYFLSEKHIFAYECYDYPKEFRELTPKEQENGLKAAKERLKRRFAGEVGVDMHYSTKSAFVKRGNDKVLSESSRTKILIATHCFFDNPHPYGVNLFPDNYEWLTFLGEISEKTDYDWYIKTHPDLLPGTMEIIKDFIRKYPKFTLLPAETSHLQIIEEGIDFALTVLGTIGFEYAALGVPVINASMCNPHVAYNFNFHPKTIQEYEKILLDLPNQKLDININEVYEYYYTAFINNVDNWLFNDYDAFLKEIGGYVKQVGPVSYQKFMNEFSEQKHDRIQRSLKNFIESREYRFQKST